MKRRRSFDVNEEEFTPSPSEKKPGASSGRKSVGVHPRTSSSLSLPSLSSEESFIADVVVPSYLPFKRSQTEERYPKGQTRGRHWKHLKQILQNENFHLLPADEPNYLTVDSPPSMFPVKKFCDISGFEAPYTDPKTKLRYADAMMYSQICFLPEDIIQGYLALRNAQVILK